MRVEDTNELLQTAVVHWTINYVLTAEETTSSMLHNYDNTTCSEIKLHLRSLQNFINILSPQQLQQKNIHQHNKEIHSSL